MKMKRFGMSSLLLLCVIYFVVYSAVQMRSARTASLLSDVPPTVVIDAGHGGEDGGASSISGVLESGLNLSIALKLEQVLALCGMEPFMIRSEDISVYTQGNTIRERKRSDLNTRLAMIEGVEKAILVSIHQNHFPESKYSGAQVFYSDNAKSKDLAGRTQEMIRRSVDVDNKRECRQAESVYIMQKISCTGILVECGFLSNPEEEKLLQDQGYQTKLSCAIGCALAQFIEKGETEVEV